MSAFAYSKQQMGVQKQASERDEFCKGTFKILNSTYITCINITDIERNRYGSDLLVKNNIRVASRHLAPSLAQLIFIYCPLL